MSNYGNDWRQDAVKLANTGVMSRREVAAFLGVKRSTCLDYLRAYYKEVGDVVPMMAPAPAQTIKQSGHDNSRILFISDMHAPYQHKNTIPFLKMLKERYNPTRIVCLGDETEGAKLSYHEHDADLPSAGDELKMAQKFLQELEQVFPQMDLLNSNHGSLVYRKAKSNGIPMHYIKAYNDILGVGKGWVWHDDLILDLPNGQQVYCHHGKSSEAIKTSQTMGMSHVCGHYHESFGIKFWSSPSGLFFAMNTGCLIDNKALCFSYNKLNLKRPIIGTGLIIDGVPVLEYMPL